MINFKKNKELSLIFLHIPKTAGTSFVGTLRNIYGKRHVTRIDMPIGKVENSKHLDIPAKIPRKSKVVHGHFRYADLKNYYKLENEIKIITWLRDPVERVISNYFYLDKILRDIMNRQKDVKNVLNSMERTLIEFARAKGNRNRMARFLNDMPLQSFDFVGVTEFFPEDLNYLATLLNWKSYKEFHHNVTDSKKPIVSEEIREEIKKLNEKDIEVYNEGLALREARSLK